MPLPAYILDHRDRSSHKSRNSDGAASVVSNAAPSTTAAYLSGVTLVDRDAEGDEGRPADQVRSHMCLPYSILTYHACTQMQTLNTQLQVENRIKEGAENLLQMPLEVCLSILILGGDYPK